MASIAIQVKHIDGRVGHVFFVNQIEKDAKYWFRYKTASGHGYIGEEVSGTKITKIKNEGKI